MSPRRRQRVREFLIHRDRDRSRPMPTSVPHIAATEPIPVLASTLQEHGALIVEGLLDRDTLDRFNQELDPLLDAVQPEREFLNPALAWLNGVICSSFSICASSWASGTSTDSRNAIVPSRASSR